MTPKIQSNKPFLFMMGAIYLFAILFSLHVGMALQPIDTTSTIQNGVVTVTNASNSTTNYLEALQYGMTTLQKTPFSVFFTLDALKVLFVFTILIGGFTLIHIFKEDSRKNIMHKNQKGSMHWNTDYKEYESRYTTPWEDKSLPDPNVLYSKHIKLGFKMKEMEDGRNLNNLIVGGSGTGKSFREIKPNIMQMNSSVVVTDPSGELAACCAKALIENGTRVKMFSTTEMEYSNHYNPFDYIYDEHGEVDEAKVSTLIYLFLKNANGTSQKSSGDPFWEKSAKALLSSLAYYMLESDHVAKKDINFNTMLHLVHSGKVDEEGSSSSSSLDGFMASHQGEMEKKGNFNSKAISNYNTFKLAPPKTANSILITCATDLQIFDNDKVKNLTCTDTEDESANLQLDTLGDEKTALFINVPQANGTFDFLVTMLYSQLFDALYTKAEKICPRKFFIRAKNGEPLFTMLDTKESAQEIIDNKDSLSIVSRSNKYGGMFYQIRMKKKVLRECMSQKYAEYIVEQLKTATVESGKLELCVPIRFLMDEFANIGEIPDFSKKLSTCRKYLISCSIVLQSISQLKSRYKDNWEEIIGNCDTKVLLGSSENDTCKYFSELLGKATIEIQNRSKSSSSKGGNSSISIQKDARNLMDPAEIAMMDNSKCIVMVRSVLPFFDDKYNFLEHPNFKLTGDYNPENKLTEDDIRKYFCNTPIEKKTRTNKKTQKQKAKIIQNITPVESVPLTKEALLESAESKTTEEFLEKVCSTPHVIVPKPDSKVIKTNTAISSATAPIPANETDVFSFASF